MNKYFFAFLLAGSVAVSNFCTYSLTKSYYFKLGKLKTALDYYLIQLGVGMGLNKGAEEDNEEEVDNSVLKGLVYKKNL